MTSLPSAENLYQEPLPPAPSPKRRGGAKTSCLFGPPSPLRGGGGGEGLKRIGRRQFLSDLGMGFTGAVLGAMLFEDGIARAVPPGTDSGTPVFPARAKSVIWLFMLGGASHLETFDPKPGLHKYAGKTIGETAHARDL